ncbi:sigma factor-like helix-turn-helix DNA-binding protein [Pseudonocardia alni]|uniref:sigma factor-like helix-turn-helix DNA-binding protein n=1 Tax=Pseudonocardia alni TaxID=33907 RepID=UPI003323BB90
MRRPNTIRAIPDTTERAKAAMAATAEAQRAIVEYRTLTTAAVQELRRTMSLGQVAAALGVSRSRIQQLEK